MVMPASIRELLSSQLEAPPESTNLSDAFAEKPLCLSVFTQFYPPDFAATGQLIEELVNQLRHHDFQVRVFTGQPGYAFCKDDAPDFEQLEYLQIKRSRATRIFSSRIRGKALNGLIFVFRSALHLLKGRNRGDLLLLTTAPPFLLIVGYLVHLLFGTPYVCLLYDLYPDVAVELKVISANHWLIRIWDAINRRIWRQSVRIIVLSSTMKNRIVAKCPEVADKISIIHNWADPKEIMPMAKNLNWFAIEHSLVQKFTVLYSGNMGRCHDMETILHAAQLLNNEAIEFVFIGGGAKRPICIDKIQQLGLTNCRFLPYQEKACLPYSLTACDLSLVSISPRMEGLVAPSKLYSALAAGRAIAAICEEHSYLHQLIAEAQCGAVFANGDGVALAAFIRRLAADKTLAAQMGEAGRRYLESHFTPEQIANQYTKVLHQSILMIDS